MRVCCHASNNKAHSKAASPSEWAFKNLRTGKLPSERAAVWLNLLCACFRLTGILPAICFLPSIQVQLESPVLKCAFCLSSDLLFFIFCTLLFCSPVNNKLAQRFAPRHFTSFPPFCPDGADSLRVHQQSGSVVNAVARQERPQFVSQCGSLAWVCILFSEGFLWVLLYTHNQRTRSGWYSDSTLDRSNDSRCGTGPLVLHASCPLILRDG